MARTDLKMGTGKIAAQVGHAVLGAYKQAMEDKAQKKKLNLWEFQGQPKIVVKVTSEA